MSHPTKEEREIGKVRARIARLQIVKPGYGVTAHLLPAEGQQVTGCCSIDVFELPDRLSCLVELPSNVTCDAKPTGDDADPEWWNR